MMIKKTMIILLLVFLLIPFFPYAESAKDKSKDWTIMIYFDADNDLDGAGIDDFNEMAKIGSTANVNVVVEMDRAEGEDNSDNGWTDTKLFYVTKGLTPTPENALMDLGEKNMGDPDTLIDFVLWAVKNYPAKHYLLDLWDHGGGWQGVCWDDTNDNDFLTMPELKEALKTIRENINRNIDVVLFDACTMGCIEVNYQIKDYADIAVGSETFVPGDGCPYDTILSPLVENPTMTPEDLAEVIVDAYIYSYSDGSPDPADTPEVTMSAFDMKKMDRVAESVDELCMLLSQDAGNPVTNAEIWRSRNNAQTFTVGFVPSPFPNIASSMIDVYDFAYEISNKNFGIKQTAKDKAEMVMGNIEYSRIAEAHGSGYPDTYGMTIYFPNDLTTEYNGSYDETCFGKDKYWDEFIHHANFPPDSADNPPPTCLILTPERWENIDGSSYLITGSAFDTDSVTKVEIRIGNGEWVTAYGTETWSYEWKTTPGKHTIYTRSFDGTGYSTVSSVNVNVVLREKGIGGYPWGIVFLLIAGVALLVMIAVIKQRQKLY
ncbi:MAG: clostripain-related cysteine peptidase [Thermoplasmatales archaeon]|nr:clostripain-related cysteine peptidase [Thermoplasmatales archaeon]